MEIYDLHQFVINGYDLPLSMLCPSCLDIIDNRELPTLNLFSYFFGSSFLFGLGFLFAYSRHISVK